MDYILLGFLAIAWAVGTPIVALVALVRTSRLREANERLASEVALLRRQGMSAEAPSPVVKTATAVEPAGEAIVEAAIVEAANVEAGPPPAPAAPFEPEPLPASEAATAVPPTVPSLTVSPIDGGWEQRLGARAFVWVGGITLALAGIFLVRYSIEEGYLSPEVRVILAALFGFALIGGAEKMRARDDRVAQALAAAASPRSMARCFPPWPSTT